jgi:hypothetical protein
LGAVVAVLVVGLGAIGALALWRRRSKWLFSDSVWNENGEAELLEVESPCVTQPDLVTFSEILTYADDDQMHGFHGDFNESSFSLI